MFQLRLPIFKKYVSVEDRMAHCPDNIPPPMEKTGKEPSLIDCLKKFHVRKHSTKVWTHEKAKQLYEQMEASETNAIKEDWVKAKDVYGSSSDESSKRDRVDKQEELELKIKSLTEELKELRGLASSMISNSDTQRPPASV
ncbi:hypothetical protein JRO89_XS06G0153200 [Xanthoceras sorbifolium]|uniref:Transposase n=1 Tax=Xanthoceras sorbifolium TaxID=99658 RepID=A0ABQ8HYS7_9ROSI|nr:hypothetical protein JRO89_XS06G0153200 [Xanthoceras sorbifolium]